MKISQYIFSKSRIISCKSSQLVCYLTNDTSISLEHDIRPTEFKYETHPRRVNVNVPKQCKLNFLDSDIARCLGFKAQRIVEEGDHVSDVIFVY